MPFKSENQRKFLWKNHPDIARRWANESMSKKKKKTKKFNGGAFASAKKKHFGIK